MVGVDQPALKELSERYADLGQLVCVRSEVWKEVLGAEWTDAHPELPFFLSGEDSRSLSDKEGLEHSRVAECVERFLSDERVFSDRSPAVEEIKRSYRLILSGYRENLPALVDERLRTGAGDPEALRPAAILALNLWSVDPRKDSEAWVLWFMVGTSFLRLKNHAKAREYLQTAVDLNPRAPEALNELGLSFAVEQEYGKAEELFKRALGQEPGNARTLAHLGALCLQSGRGREARDYLEKARELKPTDEQIESLWNMALRIKN
jgi:tetratricopeptide (TPR) repeat protein